MKIVNILIEKAFYDLLMSAEKEAALTMLRSHVKKKFSKPPKSIKLPD